MHALLDLQAKNLTRFTAAYLRIQFEIPKTVSKLSFYAFLLNFISSSAENEERVTLKKITNPIYQTDSNALLRR